MAVVYPANIDNNLTIPIAIDNVTASNANVINTLRSAIIAIETQLGVNPASIYGTVRARLDALEALINQGGGGGGGGGVVFSGDLVGNSAHQIVVGLQTVPVSSAQPQVNQVLQYNGTAWTPTTFTTTLSGDVIGAIGNNTVIKLQSIPVSSTPPTTNQVLQYNGTSWIPSTINISPTLAGDVTGTTGNNTVGQRKLFLLMGA